jgi:hypothetical protein
MRVFIIEPLLRDHSGHQFFYTQKLVNELGRRNVPSIVFAGLEAVELLSELPQVRPSFISISSILFTKGSFLSLSARLCSSFVRFIKQLKRCFYASGVSVLNEGDLIFLHDLYLFEFLATGIFFNRIRRHLKEKKCRLVYAFGFSVERGSLFEVLMFCGVATMIS